MSQPFGRSGEIFKGALGLLGISRCRVIERDAEFPRVGFEPGHAVLGDILQDRPEALHATAEDRGFKRGLVRAVAKFIEVLGDRLEHETQVVAVFLQIFRADAEIFEGQSLLLRAFTRRGDVAREDRHHSR